MREESDVSLLEVWDGTQLLQEKDSTTKAEVTRYLLQNDSYSGLRAQRQASDGVWRYFAYDVQGSTRKLLNSDGTSNLDLLYRTFGQKQASSGAGQTLMQFGAFYGYEWDADSRMWVKERHYGRAFDLCVFRPWSNICSKRASVHSAETAALSSCLALQPVTQNGAPPISLYDFEPAA